MIKRLFALLILLSAYGSAQTVPIVQPHQTFLNNGGTPCVGCKLYTYAAGTTTPQPTYTDVTGSSQNTNPITLGTDGGANIWLGQSPYKFALVNASGTPVWTVDNVSPTALTSNVLPLSGGTLTGLLTANAGICDKRVSFDIVACYGADPTGVANSLTAIQTAINDAAVVAGNVYVPPGHYVVDGTINASCNALICFPGLSPTQATTTIRLHGATHQRQDQQFSGSASTLGSLITTTSIGTDANSAIFAVTPSTGFGGLSNIDVYIEDITMRTYPDPQIGCVSLLKAAGGVIDHFHCGIGEPYPTTHTEPTHHTTGIVLPATNNDTLTRATWGEIEGFWTGISVSEHAYLENVWVGFTKQCMVINAGFHPITGKIGCQEGGVPVTVLGQATADFFLAMEIDPLGVFGCGTWCYSATDVDDPNRYLIGKITFTKVQTSVGIVGTPLSYSGGNNLARLDFFNIVNDNTSLHAWERSRLSIGTLGTPNADGMRIAMTAQVGDNDLAIGGDPSNLGVIQQYIGGTQNTIGTAYGDMHVEPYGGNLYLGNSIGFTEVTRSFLPNSKFSFQTIRTALTCSTSTAQLTTCSQTGITWPEAFADTNYTIVCNIVDANVASGVTGPFNKTASSFSLGLINFTTGTALSSGTIECIGKHD